ncbi:MAG: glycosyltransferase family 39 protein [Alphaproteobacteria bacterium]
MPADQDQDRPPPFAARAPLRDKARPSAPGLNLRLREAGPEPADQFFTALQRSRQTPPTRPDQDDDGALNAPGPTRDDGAASGETSPQSTMAEDDPADWPEDSPEDWQAAARSRMRYARGTRPFGMRQAEADDPAADGTDLDDIEPEPERDADRLLAFQRTRGREALEDTAGHPETEDADLEPVIHTPEEPDLERDEPSDEPGPSVLSPGDDDADVTDDEAKENAPAETISENLDPDEWVEAGPVQENDEEILPETDDVEAGADEAVTGQEEAGGAEGTDPAHAPADAPAGEATALGGTSAQTVIEDGERRDGQDRPEPDREPDAVEAEVPAEPEDPAEPETVAKSDDLAEPEDGTASEDRAEPSTVGHEPAPTEDEPAETDQGPTKGGFFRRPSWLFGTRRQKSARPEEPVADAPAEETTAGETDEPGADEDAPAPETSADNRQTGDAEPDKTPTEGSSDGEATDPAKDDAEEPGDTVHDPSEPVSADPEIIRTPIDPYLSAALESAGVDHYEMSLPEGRPETSGQKLRRFSGQAATLLRRRQAKPKRPDTPDLAEDGLTAQHRPEDLEGTTWSKSALAEMPAAFFEPINRKGEEDGDPSPEETRSAKAQTGDDATSAGDAEATAPADAASKNAEPAQAGTAGTDPVRHGETDNDTFEEETLAAPVAPGESELFADADAPALSLAGTSLDPNETAPKDANANADGAVPDLTPEEDHEDTGPFATLAPEEDGGADNDPETGRTEPGAALAPEQLNPEQLNPELLNSALLENGATSDPSADAERDETRPDDLTGDIEARPGEITGDIEERSDADAPLAHDFADAGSESAPDIDKDAPDGLTAGDDPGAMSPPLVLEDRHNEIEADETDPDYPRATDVSEPSDLSDDDAGWPGEYDGPPDAAMAAAAQADTDETRDENGPDGDASQDHTAEPGDDHADADQTEPGQETAHADTGEPYHGLLPAASRALAAEASVARVEEAWRRERARRDSGAEEADDSDAIAGQGTAFPSDAATAHGAMWRDTPGMAPVNTAALNSATLAPAARSAVPEPRVRRPSLVEMTWLQTTAILIGTLTIMRLFVIWVSDTNLVPDEAQYWSWAQDFAFGYFSKPPLLPWIIAGTTGVCGDTEACVRTAAPLLYAGTAFALFFLSRAMVNARTGFLVAATFATLPGVWFSSMIVTTDVPLLFFWAVALLALWQTVSKGSTGWALLLGFAIGLGLLAKYAMVYFVGGLFLLTLFDRATRRIFWPWRGLLALVVAGVIIAPHILWNVENGFATVEHTAANANWSGDLFNPDRFGKFFVDQFGVFGPVLFAALLWSFFTLRGGSSLGEPARFNGAPAIDRSALDAGAGAPVEMGSGERAHLVPFLLCFTLPPLLIVGAQAFISRAHANWAATAYVAATVLVVAWLSQTRRRWLLAVSFLLHIIGGVVFSTMMLSPDLVDRLGRANDFKRMRGWNEIGAEVRWRALAGQGDRRFTAVLMDDRKAFAEMTYYYQRPNAPLTMWDADGVPQDHYELNNPLTPDLADFVLFVTRKADPRDVLDRFETSTPVASLTSDLGNGRTRTFHFYALEGLRPPTVEAPSQSEDASGAEVTGP